MRSVHVPEWWKSLQLASEGFFQSLDHFGVLIGYVLGKGLANSLRLEGYFTFSQWGHLLLLMANFLPNITHIRFPQNIIIAFLLLQMDFSAASEVWTKESKLAGEALVPSIVIMNWKKTQVHWQLRSQQDYRGDWIRNGLVCSGMWVLWEADAKIRLDMWDVYWEKHQKDKGRRNRRRLEEPSDCDVHLTPLKGKKEGRGLPCSPVVNTSASKAGDTGLIPGQGTKIPHALWQESKT